jgi:hypothetical protein
MAMILNNSGGFFMELTRDQVRKGDSDGQRISQ